MFHLLLALYALTIYGVLPAGLAVWGIILLLRRHLVSGILLLCLAAAGLLLCLSTWL